MRTFAHLFIKEGERERTCTREIAQRTWMMRRVGDGRWWGTVCVSGCVCEREYKIERVCRSQRARLRCCAGQLCLLSARVYTVRCLCLARFHDKEEARAAVTTGWVQSLLLSFVVVVVVIASHWCEALNGFVPPIVIMTNWQRNGQIETLPRTYACEIRMQTGAHCGGSE